MVFFRYPRQELAASFVFWPGRPSSNHASATWAPSSAKPVGRWRYPSPTARPGFHEGDLGPPPDLCFMPRSTLPSFPKPACSRGRFRLSNVEFVRPSRHPPPRSPTGAVIGLLRHAFYVRAARRPGRRRPAWPASGGIALPTIPVPTDATWPRAFPSRPPAPAPPAGRHGMVSGQPTLPSRPGNGHRRRMAQHLTRRKAVPRSACTR